MSYLSRRDLLKAGCIPVAAAVAPMTARAQAPIPFRVTASLNPNDNAATHVWYEHFSQNLNDVTKGRFKFEYFPSGQLGKEVDTANQVKVGSIDLMIGSASSWSSLVPELGMLDLGYLFDSYQHLAVAMDGSAGDALNTLIQQRIGCTVMSWASLFGPRNVYAKTPIKGLADIKNMKIRVLPSPAFVETFKIMGAIPTPIPFGELYMAAQTGVVDGFEHDAATVLATKLNEVSKYCLQTQHQFHCVIAVFGKRALQKIPADIMPAVKAAADGATKNLRKVADRKEAEAMATLEAAGIVFNPLPVTELAQLRGEMEAKLWDVFAKQYPVTAPVFTEIARARAA